MAVHTFSTRTKKPQDEELVQSIKRYCDKRKIVFSSIVVEALKEWEERNAGTRL